ncbi:hypothetical protein T492DRAFT_928470 [Pavlovales sp. CCMP2436]|nr:hypothetical protein T492DRAFT_928470 [Pavlovales sp. CCMP2436]
MQKLGHVVDFAAFHCRCARVCQTPPALKKFVDARGAQEGHRAAGLPSSTDSPAKPRSAANGAAISATPRSLTSLLRMPAPGNPTALSAGRMTPETRAGLAVIASAAGPFMSALASSGMRSNAACSLGLSPPIPWTCARRVGSAFFHSPIACALAAPAAILSIADMLASL